MSEPKVMGKDALQHLFGDDDDDSDDDSDTSCSDGEDVDPCQDHCKDAGEEEAKTNEQTDGNTTNTCTSIAETRKRKSCFQPPGTDRNADDDDNHEAALRSWNQKIGILENVLSKDDCDELMALHSSHAHQGYMDHLQITRVADLVGNNSVNPAVLPLLRARYQVWERVEEFFPDTSLGIFPEYTAIASWHRGAVLQKHYDSNKEYLQDRHYSAVLYLNDPSSGNGDDHDDDDNDDDDSDEKNKSQQQRPDKHHPSNYHRCGFSGGDLVFEVPVFEKSTKSTKKSKASATTTAAATAASSTSSTTTLSKTASIRRIKPKAGRLVCFPASDDYVHGVEEITSGTRYALTMWFTQDEAAMEQLDSLQRAYHSGIFQKYFNAIGLPKNLPNCSQAEQPWETPQQQMELRQNIFERAGLLEFQNEKRPSKQTNDDCRIPYYTVTETELLHLIANCWWKRGRPLGDYLTGATRVPLKVGRSIDQDELDLQKVTIWGLYTTIAVNGNKNDNDDHTEPFHALYRDWKFDYLPKRWKGLKQSMERWMNDDGGLITNVKDSEMLLLDG